MDEQLKRKIFWIVVFISGLILLISLYGIKKTEEFIEEDSIALDRSPLQQFRLIEYREDRTGAYIDVVSVLNGQKYENNRISKTCPEGKTKQPGLLMNLSVVENLRTSTEEKFYTLDRAYDYICTNKDMKEADAELFKRIEEAKERTYGKTVIKANQPR